ncbi:uncharacterized protein B0H18DRAFT_1034578 [Fomitopsis serialis]|uniref:uncharacterized protein n=1 Tax=Fomitopsis serialis TaxID=139415 RepID=UPI0020072DF1|nr:uncharacterized protein B0H18DRAFT_1034578 [Neoantrodia serialis]KAH9917424.1 hypothetical protein B0H18DRAFT_1034578 [Neoantrodia serialis]
MGCSPPTPSPSFAPGHPLPQDTGCLPAYRESYMRRFHPYPRYPQPSWQQYEHLMQTVDLRHEHEPSTDVWDVSSLFVIDEVEEEDLANLERALSNQPSPSKRRRRLSVLVIELALAIKHIVTLRKTGSQK